jgi:hypothetical protein
MVFSFWHPLLSRGQQPSLGGDWLLGLSQFPSVLGGGCGGDHGGGTRVGRGL